MRCFLLRFLSSTLSVLISFRWSADAKGIFLTTKNHRLPRHARTDDVPQTTGNTAARPSPLPWEVHKQALTDSGVHTKLGSIIWKNAHAEQPSGRRKKHNKTHTGAQGAGLCFHNCEQAHLQTRRDGCAPKHKNIGRKQPNEGRLHKTIGTAKYMEPLNILMCYTFPDFYPIILCSAETISKKN